MSKYIIQFLIMILSCRPTNSMAAKKVKMSIGDNQTPLAYLKLGTYFLTGADGRKPDISLAHESFEKAVEQQEDAEVRAQAALQLGEIYYLIFSR